ncbi:hypothetical protein GPECTOR_11g175 [Gonium pectorale]|uniref:Protein kinase domain-containing protein n=1 Tax=Gonium pectorale TaxID=33097 RepID=A0A150GPS1_GONPE|nr:hypothetical protein GPECTOR_11g175 [Gonium pectorale]|eukprot:KXZ51728.1 hypothetical protein GPECTOR_11g175 [Gonium pectorale]
MDADAIDAPPDPEIASILKLVQSIFEAPAALVALFDDRRIFIRDAEGAFQRGDFPWRWSFCGWTMASKNDQIMVIPDATKDARFCNNAMVKSGPGVRFYCGTPLIASNGHRIGTLCFADTKPRDFDASRCVVLNNLAELVVRHLEKDIALQLRAHDNNSLAAAYGNLRRTLDCFDHCVALVDTGSAGWRILFVNNPCCKMLGIDRESLLGSYLSRLLVDADGSMLPTDEQQEIADKGREFQASTHVVHVTARMSAHVVEELDERQRNDKDEKAVPAGAQRFLLTFRPASREDLDEGTISIGVPSYISATAKKPTNESCADEGSTGSGSELSSGAGSKRPDRLYFMLLQDAVKLEAERVAAAAKAAAEAKAASSSLTPSHSSVSSSHDKELSQPPESISGLTMGHLLGKGAYGSVYYGTWYGSSVAVKIIDEELPPGAESIAPPIEAILAKELRHPHIVATLRCARRLITPSGSSRAVSTSAVVQSGRNRRSGATSGNSGLATEGSMGAFSDDTARVSAQHNNAMGAGGSSGNSRAISTMGQNPRGLSGNNSGVASGESGVGSGLGGDPEAGGASPFVAPADATGATQDTVLGTASTSQLASNAGSSVPSQNGWAIINLENGQAPRRRSSVANAAAGGAAADGAGGADGQAGNDAPEDSTDNSEAYDAFDAGGDSSMSPFLIPPGSHQTGGGVAAGAGLASHSGGAGSERWTADQVLVRHQTWLIMEYCDRGCLQDAIDRGWLRTSPALENSAPRMDAVLATAVELASALSYLHSKDIVHGDMSAWNIMLCTSGSTASVGGRGFVAKIADFGLARHLDIRTKIQTRTYGTLTHMPAETLRDGVISKATDVYSMGVLLWQLFTSSRPWAGLRHGQIIVMVVTQGARLRFPDGCPPAYEALALSCMDPDSRRRPTIENVLAELEALRRMF